MTFKIYGIGYANRTLAEICQVVGEKEAYVIDVRFSPFSRNRAFHREALRAALGERYRHVAVLGNRNYRGGPVDIVDYVAGRALLKSLDRPAILICACADPSHCHRSVSLHRLAEEGFETEELNLSGTAQTESRQLPLF